MSRVVQVNPNNRLCSILHAVCLVPVATLCVMLSLILCCPARALGYTSCLCRVFFVYFLLVCICVFCALRVSCSVPYS